MATYESDAIANERIWNTPLSVQAGVVYAAPFTVTLSAALANGDFIKCVAIPAKCVPVDCVIETSSLDGDASPTIMWDAGILNEDGDGLLANSKLVNESTVGQGAQGIQRANTLSGALKYGDWIDATGSDGEYKGKYFAIEVVDDPATGETSGYVRGVVFYRAIENIDK